VRGLKHKSSSTVPVAEYELLQRQLIASQNSVARLQRILDHVPIGIVEYGADDEIRFINERVLDMTGARDGRGFGEMRRMIIHPDDLEQHLRRRDAAMRGTMTHFRIRAKNALGAWVHVDGTFMPTFREGVLDSLVTIFRDVDFQVEQNRAILRFRAIAEVTPDIVGISDLLGGILYINQAGRKFLGRDADRLRLVDDFLEYVPVEYHQALRNDAMSAALNGEAWEGDVELIRTTDFARIPMSAVIVGVPGPDGELAGLAVTFRDLSDRKQMEAELAHAAAHDSLTGLANRQELFTSLETSLASGAPTAVLFFDLDNFKAINDSLGHPAGDVVLRRLAERIRQGARGSDVIGRLGGDEFLVISRGVSRQHDAVAIAESILASVSTAIEIDGRQHYVTGSIGISMSAGRATSAAAMIQEADIAMYRAKRDGRRHVMLFDDSMRVEAIGRMELERDLRIAVEQDQFELYLQPLVYFGRDQIQNFEALIRWNHPRHGLLLPGEFLPAVEQSGLANQVGEWAFTRAAHLAAQLRRIEPGVCIGVNVDPDQLLRTDFVASVISAMDAAGLAGDALAIEITEHAVMIDVDQSRRVLEELRSIGVSVAIDDFGTGYSNLDLLRRLPVDYLKIDRSFIAGLGTEQGDTQLVRMVLGLSQELGIEVIAEGVETVLQANELRRLGCRIAQGYLYSRPVQLADAEEMLRQQARPPSSDRIVPVI